MFLQGNVGPAGNVGVAGEPGLRVNVYWEPSQRTGLSSSETQNLA